MNELQKKIRKLERWQEITTIGMVISGAIGFVGLIFYVLIGFYLGHW